MILNLKKKTMISPYCDDVENILNLNKKNILSTRKAKSQLKIVNLREVQKWTQYEQKDYLLDVACPIGRKTEEDCNQKSLYLNDFCTSVVQDSR